MIVFFRKINWDENPNNRTISIDSIRNQRRSTIRLSLLPLDIIVQTGFALKKVFRQKKNTQPNRTWWLLSYICMSLINFKKSTLKPIKFRRFFLSDCWFMPFFIVFNLSCWSCREETIKIKKIEAKKFVNATKNN